MPGRKDTSGEMKRLEAVYKNSDARFSYIKTDPDGLDLEPLEVDDTDVVAIDKELELLQNRTEKLSESAAFGSAHTEVMEDTRERKLDTLQGRSEKFRELASENLFLTKKLAEQESNSLSLFDRFKGLFSKSKKQSGTEEYNEGSVNDEGSLDHETARKPWYRKGALGSAANWFQSERRKGYRAIPDYYGKSIISESETRGLVQKDHEFTGSTLGFFESSESPKTALKSHLNSVNLESGDTPGFMPELSEKEKIGLVQRMKNTLKTIGDCFMSLFRTTEVVDEDRVSISSRGSFTYLDGRTFQTRAETPPPSYDAATQGQTNSWTKRFSSKGTSGSFEERLKERTAVDAKGVIYTDL